MLLKESIHLFSHAFSNLVLLPVLPGHFSNIWAKEYAQRALQFSILIMFFIRIVLFNFSLLFFYCSLVLARPEESTFDHYAMTRKCINKNSKRAVIPLSSTIYNMRRWQPKQTAVCQTNRNSWKSLDFHGSMYTTIMHVYKLIPMCARLFHVPTDIPFCLFFLLFLWPNISLRSWNSSILIHYVFYHSRVNWNRTMEYY